MRHLRVLVLLVLVAPLAAPEPAAARVVGRAHAVAESAPAPLDLDLAPAADDGITDVASWLVGDPRPRPPKVEPEGAPAATTGALGFDAPAAPPPGRWSDAPGDEETPPRAAPTEDPAEAEAPGSMPPLAPEPSDDDAPVAGPAAPETSPAGCGLCLSLSVGARWR